MILYTAILGHGDINFIEYQQQQQMFLEEYILMFITNNDLKVSTLF
jgi:hypothetical protein